ncbi:MAG: hypothetical protein QOD06_2023 [Candidatus Binatota bacterium]|jgi:exopolysaccharide biosynthesis polyprenyl glycosylphosphotransferase|nr:hypothetical protein [Candidatus Binatota bacterium]
MLNPAILEVGSLFVIVCSALLFWPNPVPFDAEHAIHRLIQAMLPAACCAVSYYYNDLYDLRVVRSWGEYCRRLLRAVGIACMLLVTFYTLVPETRHAGDPLVSTVGILLLLVGVSVPLRLALYAVIEKRVTAQRVVIVGTNPLAKKIIEAIESERHFRYHIAGVTDGDSTPVEVSADEPVLRYPFVTPLSQLARLIEETRPDRIIVARTKDAELPVPELLELRGRRIVVEDGLEAYERMTGKLPIDFVAASSIIFSTDFRKSTLRLAFTRVLSMTISALGLMLTLPVCALIALAIKLDTGGAVLFVQKRIGLYGRQFRLFKFRSMHPVTAGSAWTGSDDSRITRVGHWLRKYRLDELPQLWNILKGDMNLIGPRPYPVDNRQVLIENIPYYPIRSMIRPGLTGWAQVRNGYAGGLEEEREKMCYDLYYLKHLSPWLDFRILVDTVKIVLLGDPHREPARRAAQHRDVAEAPSKGAAERAAAPAPAPVARPAVAHRPQDGDRAEGSRLPLGNGMGAAALQTVEDSESLLGAANRCFVDPEIAIESRRLFHRN